MATIWKYKILPLDGPQRFDMPEGAHIVSVALDPHGDICFWALVDAEARIEERTLWCIGTGWSFEDLGIGAIEYLGMVVRGPYVWHVLEEFA